MDEHQNAAADMHYQQQNYGGLTGLQEHQQDSVLGQQQQSPAGEEFDALTLALHQSSLCNVS